MQRLDKRVKPDATDAKPSSWIWKSAPWWLTLLIGLASIYTFVAYNTSVFRGNANVFCRLGQEAVEACDQSTELIVPPPCPLDEQLVANESSPSRFIQLYWQLVNCNQSEAALPFLTAAYLRDNSPGGASSFAKFVDDGHDFTVRSVEDVEEQAFSDGRSSASGQLDIYWYDGPADDLSRDYIDCLIDFDLARSGEGASWQIVQTKKLDGSCE